MSVRHVAVVTGAARGIGLAIAQRLVVDGFHVIAVDRDPIPIARIENRAAVSCVTGDLTSWATHELAADAAREAGTLTAWINNAGIETAATPAHLIEPEEIASDLQANLFSMMFGTSVAVRRMLSGGGAIVNLGSIQGRRAYTGYYTYQAAKAAIEMFSKGVAVDYGPQGIRCNVILPGTIGVEAQSPDYVQRQALVPVGRDGTPEEIAGVVSFLVSPDAAYVNAASLVVDGGALIQAEPRVE